MITEQVFLPVITAANTGVTRIVVVDGTADGTTSLDEVEHTAPPTGFDFTATWQAVTPPMTWRP